MQLGGGNGGGGYYNHPLFASSDLQRTVGQAFTQGIQNPLGQGYNAFQQATAALGGLSRPPDVSGLLGAYQPIFERNLAYAQEQGPRFSTGNAMQRNQALSDFNLFAQQTLESARNRQLQAATALGGLGTNAGQLGQQMFTAGGQFANMERGQQIQLMQQMLEALFKGGGINADPIYNVSPGFGQQLLGVAGSLGGALLSGGIGGGGARGATSPGTQVADPGGGRV